MTDRLDVDVDTDADPAAVAAQRDDLVAAVRSHAGELAYALARIEGGDYGRRTFETADGEWTLKHEAGELEFLRFSPRSGEETYVVSTKRDPEPAALASAVADYDAFVAAFETWVRSLDGLLADVETNFPEVVTGEAVVTERDRIVDRIREVCTQMAGSLARHDPSDYGTFTARVDGTRWELNREGAAVSYLRVGGSDGTYLLSQYGPPAAADVREFAPDFPAFVAAYNDHVDELALDLAEINL
ncbi:hypothetical protein [Halosegnis sp.]|uniref:hypothetical protein n=1 Tax=Halosegnis sp. TaxID=2864959 RepID=UPI0035D46B87